MALRDQIESWAPARRAALRFGPYLLDADAFELRQGTQRVDLPPKLFRLLCCLIERRDRVVPQHELLAVVWPRVVVSRGTLPQAMLKLRAALAEGAPPDGWVRTVRGLGYRFIGDVKPVPVTPEPAPPGRGPTPALAPTPAPVRAVSSVALLPCINATGDPSLDWVGQGLSGLVAHAVGGAPGLRVVPMTDVTQLLDEGDADGPDDAPHPAARLGRQHGAGLVVQATLTRSRGRHMLDLVTWVCSPQGSQPGPSLSVDDIDLLSAAQRMARAVVELVRPGQDMPLRWVTPDPFTNQAMARGLALMASEDNAAAQKLFEVVQTLEPDWLWPAALRLRCLLGMRDPQAAPLAEALLRRVSDNEPPELRAAVRLMHAAAIGDDPDPPRRAQARTLLAQAMQQARALPLDEWTSLVRRQGVSLLALWRKRDGGTDDSQERADLVALVDAARAEGLPLQAARASALLGMLDFEAGRLAAAIRPLREAAADLTAFGRRPNAAHCRMLLALTHWELGLAGPAEADAEACLTEWERPRTDLRHVYLLAVQAPLMADARDATLVPRARAVFTRAVDAAPMGAGLGLALDAIALWRHAREAQALAPLAEAVTLARQEPTLSPWRFLARLHLALLVRLGRHDEVAATVAAMGTLPDQPEMHGVRTAADHALAMAAWAAGHRDAARQRLRALVDHAPVSQAQALARMDLAWLEAAAGHPERARQDLLALAPWTQHHPAALALTCWLPSAAARASAAARSRWTPLQGLIGARASARLQADLDRGPPSSASWCVPVADDASPRPDAAMPSATGPSRA